MATNLCGPTPLKLAREKAGVTLAELSLATGINTGQLSRIEAGAPTTAATAEAIAKRLGGRVTELEILYPARYVRPLDERAPDGRAA